MIRVGIECESIEGEAWGVGRIVTKLLEEISKRPELKSEFRFFLYFKSRIPDYAYLQNEIFVKKIVKPPFTPQSFSLYYYVWLPIKLWFEELDLMYFPNYMLPIIFHGKSLVILTEDVYFEMYHGLSPFRYKLAYRVFANWAARHATNIMAITNSSKNEITSVFKINPDRISVVLLGVDLPSSASSPVPWNLYPVPYLLYVGQALPRRHLRETILAFEKIAPEFPELKLIAVGYDKYRPPVIRELVKKVNAELGGEAVIHKNYVDQTELVRLYSSAKTVIYVSSKEAFGLPPLEALAYGKVSIVADLPTSREIFGDDAFFVKDYDSIDSIADTMRRALTDSQKRESILSAAPEILSRYTWQKHTSRFLEVVREIANSKH